VKAAGIKFTAGVLTNPLLTKEEVLRSPFQRGQRPSTFHPSLNRQSRFVSLIDGLRRDGREDLLFWSACEIAGMVLIEDWPKPHVAKQQLAGACKRNGLREALGEEGVQQTIESAFRHVEEKILGERE
jgi:hypothetical protein